MDRHRSDHIDREGTGPPRDPRKYKQGQFIGDKGKVLGGLLGGAIGAVAAQKTGTEVTLTEGTELSIALAAPVEITKR